MNKPVKVVQMTTVHHPEDPRIYHKQCRSLAEAGFEVTYIAPYVKGLTLDEPNLTYMPLPAVKRRFLSMMISPIRAYRMVKKLGADIIHLHDPELLLVGNLLSSKGYHVVYDIHEDYQTGIVTRDYFNKPVRKGLSAIYKWIEKRATKGMTLVLAEKYYKDLYPSGIPLLNYPILDESLRNLPVPQGPREKKVLYTGNITRDRGALTHAGLVHTDADLEVHMIGKCDPVLAKAMRALAVPSESRLLIEGEGSFVSRGRIIEGYASRPWLAGLALFPPSEHYEKKELTKFFEYMLAGIPIICSDFPVWRTFVERYGCGVTVDPDDPAAIREVIADLHANPEFVEQMGKCGKAAVTNELNWSKEAEKLVALYESLMSGEK